MRHISPTRAALSVGAVVGLWHLTWVSLVALRWAQTVIDFILRLHFIEIQVEIAPFVPATAAMLVAVTFAAGALFCLVFALIWNWLGAERPAHSTRKPARAM